MRTTRRSNNLKNTCNDKNIITNEIYAFREDHSREQKALQLTEKIMKHSNRKEICSALTIDMSKVFDKVWHPGLICELDHLKISQEITGLINNIPTIRTFQVKIGNELSTLIIATSYDPTEKSRIKRPK